MVEGINWDVFMDLNAVAAMRRLEAEKKKELITAPGAGIQAPLKINEGRE